MLEHSTWLVPRKRRRLSARPSNVDDEWVEAVGEQVILP